MTVVLDSVLFRSPRPERDAAFWGGVLDRNPEVDAHEIVLRGTSRQVGLRFAVGATHDHVNRLHLHLIDDGDRDQRHTVSACERLGGRLRGSGHVPENSYAAMADVVDDEFCVIADANEFLSGCGPLGEVTCEGTAEVGRFWSRALGWPLVWEHDGETAVQFPGGGTKVSWSGTPPPAEFGEPRQEFILRAMGASVDVEVARLVALGAVVDDDGPHGTSRLRDPDGVRFEVRPES